MHVSESELKIQSARPWYSEVTAYQWLVLIVASAGWVFDVFEGQVYAMTRVPMLAEILRVPVGDPAIKSWGDALLGVFLVGGAVGGIFFGMLADRIGRGTSMILTVLMYTVFSGLTYFATALWHVALLRFLVAAGVGGEWAVAAALVAEVFPARARAHGSAIFHASSVLGTWIAAGTSIYVSAQWRYAYLVGVVPAVLVLAIRWFVREPEAFEHAKEEREELSEGKVLVDRPSPLPSPGGRGGSGLLSNREYRKRAILGLLLAAVALAGFWGVMVGVQDLVKSFLISHGVDAESAAKKAQFAYGIVATAGGGVGLVAMGPIAARLGRRIAFLVFLVGALVVTPMVCYLPRTYMQLLVMLPVFGFFNLGMHAGFAVYLPELFPTRLRATGAGFGFNGGRLIAATMLVLSGWVKTKIEISNAIALLGLVYVMGILVVMWMPETKGRALEE